MEPVMDTLGRGAVTGFYALSRSPTYPLKGTSSEAPGDFTSKVSIQVSAPRKARDTRHDSNPDPIRFCCGPFVRFARIRCDHFHVPRRDHRPNRQGPNESRKRNDTADPDASEGGTFDASFSKSSASFPIEDRARSLHGPGDPGTCSYFSRIRVSLDTIAAITGVPEPSAVAPGLLSSSFCSATSGFRPIRTA